MPAAKPLVAPTQKMSDETPYRNSGQEAIANYPSHPSQPPLMPAPAKRPGPGAAPPSSIPPQNHSIPPQNHSSPPQNHSSPPQNYSSPPQNQSIPPQNYSSPPQNQSLPPQNYSSPPQNQSLPPQNQAHGSSPPGNLPRQATSDPRTVPDRPGNKPRASSRGATPPAGTSVPQPLRGRAQTPAESIATAPPGRRWGLILFVLLIDIGLAGAGAWMLSQGLAL